MKTRERKLIKTLIIISLVFYSLSAPASEIQTGNILHISDNTTIAPDSVIDADKIIVDGSATIVNHGTISGDIFVQPGTDVRIQKCAVAYVWSKDWKTCTYLSTCSSQVALECEDWEQCRDWRRYVTLFMGDDHNRRGCGNIS